MFRVVAYFTYDTGYEREAKNLRISLDQLDIPNDLDGIVSLGSWRLNCGFKPRYILQKMEQYPDTDIVYLDCDAIVMQYPKLFDIMEEDIGYHLKDGRELLSGTLFFKNSPLAIQLLQLWLAEQIRNPDTYDQRTLQTVLNERPPAGLKIAMLPPTYTQIFDTMAHTGDPVIRHMQASRKYRGLIHAS